MIYLLLVLGVATVAAMMIDSESMAYLATIVVEIALLPAVVAITVLLYYDIRERREGLDIALALGGPDIPRASHVAQ